jgi:sugar lactone lactonase YvrE
MISTRIRVPSLLVLLTTAAACGGGAPPSAGPSGAPSAAPGAESAPAPNASAAASGAASAAPSATTPAEPPKPPAPTPAVRFTGGFATPESVLYDEARDRYLVSNINGRPVDADNNGFISQLSPDGKITNLKWIEGGKSKVTLNAPKGLAIVKDVLYVADLDTVRMFDVKSGAPKGEIKLEGATFANDVAAGDDGKVYVSDSGLKMEGADFKPTGTDAVWVLEKGKARALAKSTDLARPNGLLVDGKSLLVAPFGSNEIYRLDDKGRRSDATKLPKGGLDGIVKVGDTLLVSSWEGQGVFKGKVGGAFEPVLQSLEAPADIGYDKKRGRVLVPRFMGNVVEAYDVKIEASDVK